MTPLERANLFTLATHEDPAVRRSAVDLALSLGAKESKRAPGWVQVGRDLLLHPEGMAVWRIEACRIPWFSHFRWLVGSIACGQRIEQPENSIYAVAREITWEA